MSRALSSFLLLLLAAAPAWGDSPISFSGYLKNIWQYSRSAIDSRPYFLDTTRARLSLDIRDSVFRAHVDDDQEALAGSYFRTPEYRLFGLGGSKPWLDADASSSWGATGLWRQKLYRGWAGLENDQGAVFFGRQRVAWGTGKFWTPTDVLNPYNPLSIEPDERPGVDALYARRSLSDVSQAELAYAPQDAWAQSAILGRIKSDWRGCDFSLMGGKTAVSTASWMAGGDFAGNFLDGTLRGEWSYSAPASRTPYWQSDGGYDYTFASDNALAPLRNAAVSLEYFHNGGGVLNPAAYDFSALAQGRRITLAQDYAGAAYSKDLSAVLNLNLLVIANLDDGSEMLWPTLKWNALENLYLAAGFQGFFGGRAMELGHASNLGFLETQYYF